MKWPLVTDFDSFRHMVRNFWCNFAPFLSNVHNWKLPM